MAPSEGAEFTSLTTTLKVAVALRGGAPLSVTRTVMLLVPGPWASDGVQVKTPLVESTEAPAGAPGSRLKVSAWAGRSGSVAELVKVSKMPSAMVRLVIATRLGGLFDSITTI